MAGYYDVKFIERFIRQEAVKRGIDPDIAVKVARSEGLRPNTWQSTIVTPAGREPSYGPFQLNLYGLGDKFQRLTGKSITDPATVLDQVRFSLDEASQGGWGPWHGWKGGKWAGIRTPATANAPAGDVGGMGRGSIMAAQQRAEAAPAANEPRTQPAPTEPAPVYSQPLAGEDRKKALGGLLQDMMKQPPPTPLTSNLLPPPQGSASNVMSLPEYVQQFIAMRMAGTQPGNPATQQWPSGWGAGGFGQGGRGIG
jgi:hypothetical protein